MLDIFDDFMGMMNFFEFFGGLFRDLTSNSKQGSFGPMIQFKLKRLDKGGDKNFRSVIEHFEKHGVRTFYHKYDANYRYFKVRKSQEKWAK